MSIGQVSRAAGPAVVEAYADLALESGEALHRMVIRTRSQAGRNLLAYLASGRRLFYPELIDELNDPDGPVGRKHFDLYDPLWLSRLAQVVSVQALTEQDAAHAVRIYELVERIIGRPGMTRVDAKRYVDLLLSQGRTREVAARIWDLSLNSLDRRQINTDLANPFVNTRSDRVSIAVWLKLLEATLGVDALASRIAFTQDSQKPFDCLTSRGVPTVTGGPLITVIVTTYKPDQGLVTAVRSLIEQSWRSVEILVIDDGSPPEYDQWLRLVEQLDSRVRVVRLETNVGTYKARNVGLAIAAGDFVTFQDSDDWSHPQRLQQQVKPLMSDRSLMATTSSCVRTDEELILASVGYETLRLNTSSLMFRLHDVIGRIGFMDGVRKGADSEYLKRIAVAFDGQHLHLKGTALSVIRRASGSLSRNEFLPGWHHSSRATYREAYEAWHRRIAKGASPYVEMEAKSRRFPAPARIEGRRVSTIALVLLGDWRLAAPMAAMDDISADLPESMAIAQMDSFAYLTVKDDGAFKNMQRIAAKYGLTIVHFDDEWVIERVVVAHPDSLQFPSFGSGHWKIGQLEILVNESSARSEGVTWDRETCLENARDFFGIEPTWVEIA